MFSTQIDLPVRGGHHPSQFTPPRRKRPRRRPVGVDELARRYADGVDLWSGVPLTGKNADDWLRAQFEMGEEGLSDQEVEMTLVQLEAESRVASQNRLEMLQVLTAVA